MAKQKRQAATSSPAILVSLYDGTRNPWVGKTDVLLRVRDGFQKELLSKYLKGNQFQVAVPFHDNVGDYYTVLVVADGYRDIGFHPVKLQPHGNTPIDLMLLPKDADFKFAKWEDVSVSHPYICAFLGLASSPTVAKDRYDELRNKKPPVLASLLNLVVAMSQIQLQRGTPLDYFKELKWDDSMAQDRFFAYCDPALIDQARMAVSQHIFLAEPGPSLFHPGATCSFKQAQFGEANVQLTFHEEETKKIQGKTCVIVEPDIDYFSDVGAHTLMEVIPNVLTHGLTDPKMVYVLRWIAGRHAGVPEFDPPYTLE